MLAGLFLGLVPMKAGRVTAKQSKASQMVSFIVAIVFIGLLVAGHDLETWAMVIGLVIGFAVAKIPALHAWALHKWPFFEPKKAAPLQARQESQEEVSSGLTYSLKAGYRHRYPVFHWPYISAEAHRRIILSKYTPSQG